MWSGDSLSILSEAIDRDGMNSDTELTLQPSKSKWVLILLGSAVFVAIAYWAGPEGLEDDNVFGISISGETIRIVGMVFFGASVLVAGAVLVPGTSYLRLTQSGFVWRSLFRRRAHKWNEIDSFGIAEITTTSRRGTQRTKSVGFNFAETAEELVDGVARATNRQLCGFDAMLPDTYGMSVEELAKLMNEWKERFAG